MNEEHQPFDSPPPEPVVPMDETPDEPAETLPPPPPPPTGANIRAFPPVSTRPAISSGEYWRTRSDDLLAQLGIDARLAARALIIAVLAAALGALLDEILGLPGTTLRVTFGGTLVAGLSGLTYAYFKGREDAPGLIMAAVGGLVAYTVWYIVRDIVGFAGLNMNVFKAMVSGVLAGILGFGWLVLLREVTKRVPWKAKSS
mgnify:CR=1 FL=1